MKPGQKVVCVDDQYWLIPSPGLESLAPKKGRVYTVREYDKFGGVGAISLMEGHPDDFYRACRFKPLQKQEITRADCIREAIKLCAHLKDL